MQIKNFTAAKALIHWDGKILLLRESSQYHDGAQTGKYDVPGGRLNPGEDLLEGLKREVLEESGLDLLSAEHFFVDDVVVEKPDEIWHISRNYFSCAAVSGEVILSKDHDVFLWIDAKKYREVPIIENLAQVFEAYLKKFNPPGED
ncbi:MAG: 7,8-dihydro-8-oxoguanine triphosphatase [Alphaproteobacteria bacterium]|nr:7,8-dihydro-8-oxoguanine triphosphatase [Alphaproteobacteria bacterium]